MCMSFLGHREAVWTTHTHTHKHTITHAAYTHGDRRMFPAPRPVQSMGLNCICCLVAMLLYYRIQFNVRHHHHDYVHYYYS